MQGHHISFHVLSICAKIGPHYSIYELVLSAMTNTNTRAHSTLQASPMLYTGTCSYCGNIHKPSGE